ncbi:uncharacterized protein LOC143056367 [Mytilus galloprovincialis]|uniref:uncharacterized protein LOC143056367 n=1 Tax=Mytilus galloprovincialis TaxID=29158 RepID=UPI003F7BFD01
MMDIVYVTCLFFVNLFSSVCAGAWSDTLTNVALWKESRQDSIPPNASLAERGPQLGNDGNIDTIGTNYVCAHTGFDSEYFWWTVNFEKEYIIEKVKIYGRTDCCKSRLRHFDILVYNPSTTSWDEYNTGRAELCHHQYNQSPTPLSVTCKQGRMKGKFVKILMKKKQNVFSKQTLTLCEVEVWGRIRTENFTSDSGNLALYKVSRQSSTWNEAVESYGPQIGNDGITDYDNFPSGFVTQTDLNSDVTPWWEVDLDEDFVINTVIIYNRKDCCSEQLSNFDIFVYASSDTHKEGSYQSCYHYEGDSALILNITCKIGTKGRFVEIKLQKIVTGIENSVLALCEVEIYGSREIYTSDVSGRKSENTTHNDLQCPCSCDYKRQLEFMASTDLPNYTMEQWREILQPRLKELQRELKLDRKTLSKSKRKMSSAVDNRGSARNLGIIGVTILVSVLSLIVLDDLLTFLRYVQQIRRVCGV